MNEKTISHGSTGQPILPQFNNIVDNMNIMKEDQISFLKKYQKDIISYEVGVLPTDSMVTDYELTRYEDNRYIVFLGEHVEIQEKQTPAGMPLTSIKGRYKRTEKYVGVGKDFMESLKTKKEWVVAKNYGELPFCHNLLPGAVVMVYWIKTMTGVYPLLFEQPKYHEFNAIITGYEPCKNKANAWTYEFKKANFGVIEGTDLVTNVDTDKPRIHRNDLEYFVQKSIGGDILGGPHYAINTYESFNDNEPTTVLGIGTTVSNLTTDAYLSLMPVQIGNMVTMKIEYLYYGMLFYFSEPNGVDGGCDEPEEE